MSQTSTTPQITGKMFLFEDPRLLNKEQHGNYGLKRAEQPYAFCAKIRAVPVTISEFISAARHYPIIFNADKTMIPLAVVGIIDDVNLFVDENGQWEENVYVPGYLRRYPFALANETGGERAAIVFDAAHGSVLESGEIPLFVDGEPSETMRGAIEFCQRYEADRRGAEQAMRTLETFDLVSGQTMQYGARPEDEQKPFAQYFGIEEKRLNELPDDKFLELRRSGLLPIVYAQMMSLGNWRAILERRARRFNLTGDKILEKLTLS